MGDCALWGPHTKDSHSKNEASSDIIDSDDIEIFWQKFGEFINRNMRATDTSIIVAYNCGTCGLKWLWKLTQVPKYTLSIIYPTADKIIP